MTTLALLASLPIAGYAAWYTLLCAGSPFGRCRRCHGAGRLRQPIARRLTRLCPRCDGTGINQRIGRRIYEHLRHEYRDGTK